MKTNYNFIYNIFIQSSLMDFVIEQKVKSLEKGFIFNGEMRYWFWRYVFMKDLTKKALTNQLLKNGFDNLTTIEIIDALNTTKELVADIFKQAKEEKVK